MRPEQFVTMIEVDGYDCSYDDRIVVTKGFNRWVVTLKDLRYQTRSDRPTYIKGYNIDPKQFPDLTPPFNPKDIVDRDYKDADWYFRLTATGAKEMLESWGENRVDKDIPFETMNLETIREFRDQLQNYVVMLNDMELVVETGFGVYPQTYVDYQEMIELKKMWDNI